MESLLLLTKYLLSLLLALGALYLIFRLASKAIFKSYFETKPNDIENKKKGEN